VSCLILDAGAFVGYERGDASVRARIVAAQRHKIALVTSSPIVAQVWRDGRRQALVAMLLAATRVDPPDAAAARRAGELLARTRTSDVVDALLVGLARTGDAILTSDPHDIGRLADASRVRFSVLSI
jgi:predicted nucleic acid-binding protein